MKNVVGGFCVGFGFCWGAMVAFGGAAVLVKASGLVLGIAP